MSVARSTALTIHEIEAAVRAAMAPTPITVIIPRHLGNGWAGALIELPVQKDRLRVVVARPKKRGGWELVEELGQPVSAVSFGATLLDNLSRELYAGVRPARTD